jgi:hypothetical protein
VPFEIENIGVLLHPHEAYDQIGAFLFPGEWEKGYFHTGDPLQDSGTIKEQLEAGQVDPNDVPEGLDDGAYDRRQVRARRSRTVFNRLLQDVLSFGKSVAWREGADGTWQMISFDDWRFDEALKKLLEDCIEAEINRNEPAPTRIGIEKSKIDRCMHGWIAPKNSSLPEPEVRRDPYRPPLNFDAAKDCLLAWERDGTLNSWVEKSVIREVGLNTGWRIDVCEQLSKEPINWYPTGKGSDNPPAAGTLRDRLGATLDEIEGRYAERR